MSEISNGFFCTQKLPLQLLLQVFLWTVKLSFGLINAALIIFCRLRVFYILFCTGPTELLPLKMSVHVHAVSKGIDPKFESNNV